MTELEKRNLTTTKFKKRYCRLYNHILHKYGGKDNIFDFCAAFTLYVHGMPNPRCDVCGDSLSITKKYREKDTSNRCKAHINTNNIITRDYIEKMNLRGYEIIKVPDKVLTKTDSILVKCEEHGEYNVSIGNFISGMQCQQCYFKSMLGKPGVVHTSDTRKKLSEMKLGATVSLTEDSRRLKKKRQQDAWSRRKKNIDEYESYLQLLSERRKEYIKENGYFFPKKDRTGLEIKFEEFLTTHGLSFQTQYVLEGKKFDFYIDDLDLLVEVDGEYWHRLESSIKNDKEKHLLCAKNNIQLVRISSDNFIPEIIFEDEAIRTAHTQEILKNRGINGF